MKTSVLRSQIEAEEIELQKMRALKIARDQLTNSLRSLKALAAQGPEGNDVSHEVDLAALHSEFEQLLNSLRKDSSATHDEAARAQAMEEQLLREEREEEDRLRQHRAAKRKARKAKNKKTSAHKNLESNKSIINVTPSCPATSTMVDTHAELIEAANYFENILASSTEPSGESQAVVDHGASSMDPANLYAGGVVDVDEVYLDDFEVDEAFAVTANSGVPSTDATS